MKTILTTMVLFFFINISDAQIFGSNDVCPAYRYSYSATIVGAAIYQWNFPPGWYNITGQGTGTVTVTCNENYGDIYCEGIDAAGNSIATLVLVTQFGGGAAVGWDVQPQNSTSCVGDPYVLNVVPNGSGGGSCPNGCGNGTAILNVGFAVYDNVWPSGNFVGFANGSSLPVPINPGSYTYYIYNVDYTNGTSTTQAVRIEGGCGTATVNNIVQLTIPFPMGPGFTQVPDPVCIGDTVSVWATFSSGSFVPLMGITILNQSGGSMSAVVNSMPARANYSGLDFNGCPVSEICYINVCAPTTLAGDTTVCAGYTYTYTSTIAGAVTYDWLLPFGWYNITGQGTATIYATCNLSDGWITVSGHDASGAIVGVENIQTHFGGGGNSGWDVQPAAVSGCANVSFTVGIVPNGTGGGSGCPPGCGNGIVHPNIVYGLYSNVWPTGYFLGFADGVSPMFFGPFGGPAYVYKVDVSNGTNPPQAILIEGGCGAGTVNNICTINSFLPNPPVVMQLPMPACIGDTVQLTEVSGLQNIGWGFVNTTDLNFLSPQLSNPIMAVVTGNNPTTDVTGVDFNGCMSYDPYVQVAVGICAAPSVQFSSSDTVFCDKQSVNFNDLSSNNPTSWQWTFNGAVPATSTLKNPQNIYYPTNGAFDVTLVACNAAGCDSLHLVNFIVEHISPVASISQSNDTLYVTPANTYQWYEVDSGLIAGAINSFFVPTQAGNYYCIIVDAVGCSGSSSAIAINTGILNIGGNWQPAISPNPNDGNFLIALDSDSPIQKLKMEIINVLGETVFINNYSNVGSTFKQQVNISKMPKGVYYLKVSGGEKAFSEKIILQ